MTLEERVEVLEKADAGLVGGGFVVHAEKVFINEAEINGGAIKAASKKTADTDNCSPVFLGTVYSAKIYGELMKPVC